MAQGTQPATTDHITAHIYQPKPEHLASLRAFVTADPVEFTETGNRIREERIQAASAKASDALSHPDVDRVTVHAKMPALTVADVIEAQKIAAEILAAGARLVSEAAS